MSGKLQLTGMLHVTYTLYYMFRYITMLLLYICVRCEAKMQTDIFKFQSVIS